jgi:type I restriction enzyme S subunit
MKTELNTKTLGEICDQGGGEVKTGPFGSQLHQSDYVDDGIPVVMPKNIIDGKVSEDGNFSLSTGSRLMYQIG